MKRGVLILLACCRYASALNPSLDLNQYAHTAWTRREGFFKGGISAIAQTPDGYLWLGTQFGLLRFDGIRAVPWQPPAPQKLPSPAISRLLTAHDGTLWIGTPQGLASWKDGKLTSYPEFAGLHLLALIEDREGTVWASAYAQPIGRLCAIRPGDVQCSGQDGSFGAGILSLYENEGYLWASAPTGLWRWKPGPPQRFSMPSPDVHAMIRGDGGTLLIAAKAGLERFIDGRTEPYSIPDTAREFYATKFLRDGNGRLWIGTASQGVLLVHQGKTDRFARSDGLSGDDITALYEDREGSIWIATNEGLDRFRDLAVPTISQGLIASALAAADGSVWVGTYNGLNRWKNGQLTVYTRKDGLPDDSVESLLQDDRSRIWIATARGVVYFENGHFVAGNVPPGGYVHAIAQDSLSGLWINQDQGLVHLTGVSNFQRIPRSRIGSNADPWSMVADPKRGGLWLGLVDRMVYFKDGEVKASYGKAEGLGAGRVADLRLDDDGTVWAATDGGLSRLKDGHITTLTSKSGLPCDSVHWALEDDNQTVWLYMACGLARISRADLDAWAADPMRTVRTTVLDSSDGVRILESPGSGYSPRAAKSKDGRLWFVAGGDLNVIDPRYLAFNSVPPPVQIEQISADHKIYWGNSPGDKSSNPRLPPLVRELEIDYTALSLVAPDRIRFKYKLEGKDPDWQDAGNRRQAFYNDLAPRNYRFRVIASNNSGVWNEAGAAFDFSIAPAYYQTRWFQASSALAFLALLWGLYRYRLYHVAREFNVRLDERVGERTRLARDLHDTLLQGFQGLMLRLQALDDLLPQGEAKEELEQTLDRADQVVTESRKAVHDLRLSTVVTNDLARAVRTMGDELSSEGSATFELLVEGETRELHPIVRDEVYRITREALRNAFDHARAAHIEAEVTYGEQLFRLRIRDDGEGIAPAILEDGRPGHYGLPGMRERAAEIGATLDIWSGIGAGTEVDLSVPGSIAYGKRPGRSRLRLFLKKEV